MHLNPDSILDIGCGFGKYGVLSREYLELWDGSKDYCNFTKRIDAVEAFSSYITPLHKFIYNNIYEKNIIEVIGKLDYSYDVVLLIDVLEHFDKGQGMKLLKTLVSQNKGIIISTPKKFANQSNCFGNEYERHRSYWNKKELASFGDNYFAKDKMSLICYVGKDAKNLQNSLNKKPPIKWRIKDKFAQYKTLRKFYHKLT